MHGDLNTRLTELLAKALPASSLAVSADHEICGLAYHSAEVRPGDLFVAVRGFNRDGHDYAAEAVRRGAPAVVVDHVLADVAATQIVVPDTRWALAALAAAFYGDPSRHLWVCGVTGTNGKTTTTHLIHAILSAAGHRSAVIGTVGVVAPEGPLPWHFSTSTTPEAPDLQRLLRDLRSRAVEDVVIEVTSHALELSRVACCRFQAAVFTNLTQDHLDFHGDLVRYRDAKTRLFAMVDHRGVSVINADDPASRAMAAASRARVVTYGIDAGAQVRAVEIELTAHGTRFSIVWPRGRQSLRLRLPGRFNVANALAAFAVLVDYAHSPDSLEKILRLAAQVSRGRCIVVFGCGGDRDRTKRPIMGRIGTQLADYAVFTSDNPRGEDPLAIIHEIEAGAAGAGNFESIPDRGRAIERGIALAEAGDVVVIAGKGHETYQILGERVHAFDDRQVAREVLRARQHGVETARP